MASAYILSFMFILTQYLLLNCASAAVHSHSLSAPERESDGAYRARDADHYPGGEHNTEFDHEAIIGSVREAEEFDRLSPEEAKERLGAMLVKMDTNKDQLIDRTELIDWILNSFRKLSREEAEERLKETDSNNDGIVTWKEYLYDSFGVEAENEILPEDTGDTGMLVEEEREMWIAADKNHDGVLDADEFEVFTNPEEHPEMHVYLVKQTLREKDADHDGRIDFNEFIGDRGGNDEAWVVAERDKFDHELDADRDGSLDDEEVRRWVVPENEEIATEEAEHLFETADDDSNGFLTFAEVLKHYHQFVGSEATAHGDQLMGEHFDDEL